MGARLTDSVLSMGAHLTDSALYGHLWATDELRRVFDEGARVQGWLDVLATLAQAQAELGIIPEEAAKAIAAASSVELLDLGAVAEETRRTGHSTLGLIRGLQAVLPDEAREWVYYGATVQDLTDTWSALAARYDERQLIEVPMLVGHYHLMAFTLNSLGVQLEAEYR